MNDAASELYDALADETGAGEPLELLAGRIFPDEADFARARNGGALGGPAAWLRVGPAFPTDLLAGSRWQVLEGSIAVVVVAEVAADDDAGWTAARESVNVLTEGVERVLMANRYRTSATNPLGAWHHLSIASGSGGQIRGGPMTFAGMMAWGQETVAALRLRRYRLPLGA